ncbi:MAG: hypothetical protein HY840_07750 [Bacteroidetes bacterium]|nr:hypothetical protein [Bacteroidota bacterium]
MDKKEVLNYLLGINKNLTKGEINKRYIDLKNGVFKKLPDKTLIKMAKLYRESEIPEHILNIINEYGLELIFEETGFREEFEKGLYERKFNVFPDEGLKMIRDYFNNFNNELYTTGQNDINNYL